ncbi:nitrous oxide reductase accessory protein NosL [Shewanella sp. GXUN23E]|uniref:nitrous oxide reductase accessory protein NosL n=1 Tax=Shewanella sp. GXUN23E TaxID=3422498 RepID=UPI003D7E6912
MDSMRKLLFAVVILVLAGCSDSVGHEGHNHPVALDDHDRCFLCGMVITKYPGSKGELILKDSEVVAKFCSVRDMFNFVRQKDSQRQIAALYVHDAGKTNWENPADTAFIDAEKAYYVFNSSRKAAMGSAIAPFSQLSDARAFINQYGGEIVSYENITLELLAIGNKH